MFLKLDQQLQSQGKDNAMLNELVIIASKQADVGLQEYLTLKTQKIIEAKKLPNSTKNCLIKLLYPNPTSSKEEFNNFMESPRAFCGNTPFKGCFAIDITFYKQKLKDNHFLDLKRFMLQNPNIVFLCMAQTKNPKEAKAIFHSLNEDLVFCYTQINAPTASALSNYVRESIGLRSKTEQLESFFIGKEDFRIADALITSFETYLNKGAKNLEEVLTRFESEKGPFHENRYIGY